VDYPISVPSIGLVGGKFVNEDPLGGTPGSLIPAQWGNAVIDEILKVITSAGLIPSEENNNQLLAAIKAVVVGVGVTLGRLIGIGGFTSSSAYTPGLGTTSVIVELQGGGGGGAAATAAAQASAGSGGSAGSYSKSRLQISSLTLPVTITVGAAGAGGAAGNNGGANARNAADCRRNTNNEHCHPNFNARICITSHAPASAISSTWQCSD
jgi:hypothetical protein